VDDDDDDDDGDVKEVFVESLEQQFYKTIAQNLH
jgi:hypothetical protein